MTQSRLYNSAYKMAYLYLVLPFLIFAIGWMKPLYAIACCGIALTALWRVLRGIREENSSVLTGREKKVLVIAFFIIIIWVGMSGIGQVAYQNEDHIWRNAMFEVLVEHEWPIIRKSVTDGGMGTGFSYYIGYWLPAACVGKQFGMGSGYDFQILWAVLGIYLFYVLLCRALKRISLWPLIIFICFSGMDILGYYFMGAQMSDISQTVHLEWWASAFQYSSFTTQLFWVFNQAIPAWLATIIFLSWDDNENMIFLWASMLINCTMPFAGMVPILFCRLLRKEYFSKTGFQHLLKQIFSWQNVAGGGIIGIVSLLYLNKGGGMFSIGLFDVRGGGWLLYFVFLMLEIGILGISIYWAQKKNPFFYASLLWLCMCPLLDMYGGANFCMRASIPALLVLAVCTIQTLYQGIEEKKHYAVGITAAILLVGAVTPLHEINRTVAMTKESYIGKEFYITQPPVSFDEVMDNDYETVDIEESIFFQYLSKEN